MNTTTEKIQSIPLAEIVRSATNREIFDPKALEEIAVSIREKGVVQPIVVRPVSCIEDEVRRAAVGEAKYELVVGERRWRGSKIAGKEEIPAVIRSLNDYEALTIQVIENAQREDPDPLEEAEQYDALLKTGEISVEELSTKIGKSKRAIYERTKLLDLPNLAKEALRKGKITAAVAVLIARIPNTLLAEEAARRILKGGYNGQPLPFEAVQDAIHNEYMTRLKDAPFDPKDKTLVEGAGPCAACPKRTGNQKELFADVGRADVCTDTACFKAKVAAARERRLEEARKAGKKVLTPEESAKLYPYDGGNLDYNAPVVELDARCSFEPRKTWAQVVAKLPKDERPEIMVAFDKRGGLHEVIGRKEAGEAARTLEIAPPEDTRGNGSLSPEAIRQRQQMRDTREQHERAIRAVGFAIEGVKAKQAKAKDTKALSRLLLMLAVKFASFDTMRRVAKLHGYVNPKKDGDARAFFNATVKKAATDPLPLALETMLWQTAQFIQCGLPDGVADACRIYGLDVKKIAAAAKQKPTKGEAPKLLAGKN